MDPLNETSNFESFKMKETAYEAIDFKTLREVAK